MHHKFFPDSWNRKVLTVPDVLQAFENLPQSVSTDEEQIFDLSGNSIPAGPMKAFAVFLSKRRVSGLNLSDVMASINEMEAYNALAVFSRRLVRSPSLRLTFLDLSDNALGEAGIHSLSPLIVHAAPTLLELNINNVGFSREACEYFLQLLSPFDSLPLEKLTCDNNYLSNAGCTALSAILAKCKNMRHLRVSSCRISEEGLALLWPSVHSMKNLEHLDLSDSVFTSNAIKCLEGVLGVEGPALKKLGLGMAKLDRKKIKELREITKRDVLEMDASYSDLAGEKEDVEVLLEFVDSFGVKGLQFEGNALSWDSFCVLLERFQGDWLGVRECDGLDIGVDEATVLIEKLKNKQDGFRLLMNDFQFERVEDFTDWWEIAKVNQGLEGEVAMEVEEAEFTFKREPRKKEEDKEDEEVAEGVENMAL